MADLGLPAIQLRAENRELDYYLPELCFPWLTGGCLSPGDEEEWETGVTDMRAGPHFSLAKDYNIVSYSSRLGENLSLWEGNKIP